MEDRPLSMYSKCRNVPLAKEGLPIFDRLILHRTQSCVSKPWELLRCSRPVPPHGT